jgi:hypothetical protein
VFSQPYILIDSRNLGVCALQLRSLDLEIEGFYGPGLWNRDGVGACSVTEFDAWHIALSIYASLF